MLKTVEEFEKLASALGADLESVTLTEAKQAATTAAQAFKDVVAAGPGLRVLILAGTTENAFIVNPKVVGDGIYYHELGLDIVMPEYPSESTGYNFEEIRW